MTRAALLAVTLLLCACGSSASLPPPTILSVTPNRVDVNAREDVIISLDAVIPVHVDYGKEQASPAPVQVWIDSKPAELKGFNTDGTLTVAVPELGPGDYEVRVSLGDGREARKPEGLTVITPRNGQQCPKDGSVDDIPAEVFDAGILIGDGDGGVAFDAGDPVLDDFPKLEEGDVTGFSIQALGDQTRGQPFLLLVRALGPRSTLFRGPATLSVNKNNGGVSPTVLTFVDGTFEGFVAVSAQGGNVKLTVTDSFGAQGTSNGFKVK